MIVIDHLHITAIAPGAKRATQACAGSYLLLVLAVVVVPVWRFDVENVLYEEITPFSLTIFSAHGMSFSRKHHEIKLLIMLDERSYHLHCA